MRYFRTALTCALFILLSAATVQAAGDAHTAINWSDLLWRFVTIGLVAAVIWKLGSARILAFFSGRRDGIAKELDTLTAARKKAQDDLQAVEKRIANLENERVGIIAEYTARGEAIKMEIIAKAEKQAEQIASQAKTTAQNEIDKALTAMREEIAEEIVELAQKSLRDVLTEKDHEKLLNRVLDKVVLQ